MAIQMRRGPWSQFDPTKMLPGEWAVILSGHPDTSNGQALYHCFAAGSVKQIATFEDAVTIIANATEDIRDELTQDIASALAQVGAATNAANTATANANTATSAANAATQAATSASERAEDAIDAMGDISELAVPLMSKDIRGGAKLEEHGGLVLRDEKLGIGSLVQESDGAVRGGIAGLTAEGHAEQVATSGKNLLPSITTQVKDGVTFTANADGSITANGTATTLILFTIPVIGLATGSTYTYSGCPENGSDTSYLVTMRNGPNASGIGADNDVGSGATFTKTDAHTDLRYTIRIVNGYTCNNLTFYPMVEAGSTKTEYEPHTGGAPSPSPEFPQTIEVVRGRNLLPMFASGSESGITCTANPDGSVHVYGKSTSSTAFNIGTVRIESSAGLTYTISGCPSDASLSKYFIRLACRDSNGTGLVIRGDMILYNIYTTGTFTTPPNTAYINVYITIASGATVDGVFYPQLERGTVAHDYVPYGHVGMEVQGKNLLDTSHFRQSKDGSASGITWSLKEDGRLVVNGTATARVFLHFMEDPHDNWFTDFASQHIGEQLSISGCPSGGSSSTYMLNLQLDGIGSPDYGDGAVATIPSSLDNANQVYVIIYAGTVCNNLTFYPQLELGSTPTPYEPYYHTTTPIPLPPRGWVAGLPDSTGDMLMLDGAGKVEWELVDDEVVLDGSENWKLQNNGTSVSTNSFDSIIKPSVSNDIASNLACSNFPAARPGYVWLGIIGTAISVATTDYRLRFADGTGAMTVANWTAWLSTHPVTVLYPLATPVTEDCGYVQDWPTDIPEDAAISIPELDAVNIEYFIDSTVTELARQWYARAQSEYETRLSTLESIVAELV